MNLRSLFLLNLGLLFSVLSVFADKADAQEISQPNSSNIISKNKRELQNQSTVPDSGKTEKELEAELAKELGFESSKETQSAVSQQTQSARRNAFQNMNPNISVIGTFLGSANTMDDLERNMDLSFQEGEFSFRAAVDPYAKADFYVAFGKHGESELIPDHDDSVIENNGFGEDDDGHGEGGLEPELEEAYITFLSLPLSTQLKLGKFRGKFGKINETHPHAYNFIDVPLMYSNFLGPEGLNDEGIGLSWLLPHSLFYQELTIQMTAGPSENMSFTRAEGNKLLYLAHLKSFFDLNENTTLELGLTGLTGPNSHEGDVTKMIGGDLTLKWKPLQQNRYESFEWLSEILLSQRDETGTEINSLGFFSHLRYQFAKRWFVGGLYEYSEFPEFSDFNHKAYSGIIQFLATEFQKIEFQYKYNDGSFFDDFSEFKLRAVFVIGAHGAHQY